MKLTTKRAVNTALLIAAFSVPALRADAQHATVNLPVEVHWGTAVLQPGKYAIDVPLARSWPQQISVTQNGRAVSISAMTEGAVSESDNSYLRLVVVEGTYFVREYNSGSTGKQFTFRIPEAAQHGMSVESQGMTLPVGPASN